MEITPEEIKWMCGYADGFELTHNEHAVSVNGRMSRPLDDWHHDQDWHIVYPHLLQRTIEGVNRESYNRGTAFFPYRIHQTESSYAVETYNSLGMSVNYEDFHFAVRMDHDNAKLAALRYIMKQEQ